MIKWLHPPQQGDRANPTPTPPPRPNAKALGPFFFFLLSNLESMHKHAHVQTAKTFRLPGHPSCANVLSESTQERSTPRLSPTESFPQLLFSLFSVLICRGSTSMAGRQSESHPPTHPPSTHTHTGYPTTVHFSCYPPLLQTLLTPTHAASDLTYSDHP